MVYFVTPPCLDDMHRFFLDAQFIKFIVSSYSLQFDLARTSLSAAPRRPLVACSIVNNCSAGVPVRVGYGVPYGWIAITVSFVFFTRGLDITQVPSGDLITGFPSGPEAWDQDLWRCTVNG